MCECVCVLQIISDKVGEQDVMILCIKRKLQDLYLYCIYNMQLCILDYEQQR